MRTPGSENCWERKRGKKEKREKGGKKEEERGGGGEKGREEGGEEERLKKEGREKKERGEELGEGALNPACCTFHSSPYFLCFLHSAAEELSESPEFLDH